MILASYIGSFFMAGAFLAIGSCVSALTKNQVIAFVLAPLFPFLLAASTSSACALAMGGSSVVSWAASWAETETDSSGKAAEAMASSLNL